MATVAQVTIEMAANVARLRTDMDAVKTVVADSMKDVKSSIDSGMGAMKTQLDAVKGSLDALKIIAIGQFFLDLTKSTGEASAGLLKMSQITGASVEGLSAIRPIAKIVGTDMETLSSAMIKLAKNVETGSNATSTALNAIGLSSEALKGLKTDEQFLKIAKALDGYADGAGKTAFAVETFGKAGAQLLPVLKALGETQEFVVKVTSAQAKEGEDLERGIRRLIAAKTAWQKIVGMELVPVLGDLVKVLVAVQKENNGTLDTAKKFAADGSITRWAQDATIALAQEVDSIVTLGNQLKFLWEIIKGVGTGFVGLADYANAGFAAIAGNWSSAQAWATSGTKNMAEAGDKLKATWQEGAAESTKYTDKVKAQFAETAQAAILAAAHFAKFGDTLEGMKPKITGLGEKAAGAAKDLAALQDAVEKAMTAWKVAALQAVFQINTDDAKEKIKELDRLYKQIGSPEAMASLREAQLKEVALFAKNAGEKYAEYVTLIQSLEKKLQEVQGTGDDATRRRWVLQKAIADEQVKALAVVKDIGSVASKNAAIDAEDLERQRVRFKELSDGMARVKFSTDDYITGLQNAEEQRALEVELIGKTQLQQDILKSALQAELEIRKLNVEITRIQLKLGTEENEIQRKILNAEIEGIEKKIAARKATEESVPAALALKKATTDVADAWKSVSDTSVNFFNDLFNNGTKAFGNLWTVIKKFFFDLAAQFATKFVIQTLMGGPSSGGGGTLNSIMSLFGGGNSGSDAGGDANGGAMSGERGSGSSMSGGAGLIGVLSMFGPIGTIIGVIATVGMAIVNLTKRQDGFKIDNNLTNVGNPASHFTQNALSNYDISGRGTDSAETKAAMKPFTDRVNAIDDILANQLLGADTLAKIRANMNAVKNATSWENLDAKGIEKGSKDFLMQRYGVIFDEVDSKIAATIRGFTGTADALLIYIASAVAVIAALKDNALYFKSVIGAVLTISDIAAVAKEGETLADTLNRVVGVFRATNGVAAMMGKDAATAFGAVGLASLAARQNLVDLAGGIQQLDAMSKSYYDHYYSQAERDALTLKQQNDSIKATFDALGIATPKSTAEFRALVEAQDLSTKAGRATWDALMKVEGAFYKVNTSAAAVVATIGKLDSDARTMYLRQNQSNSQIPDRVGPRSDIPASMGPGAVIDPRITQQAILATATPSFIATISAMVQRDAGNAMGPSGGALSPGAGVPVANQALIDFTITVRNLGSASTMANDAIAKQSNSVLYAYNKQAESMQGLVDMSPRAANAFTSVANGMIAMRDATAAFLVQVQSVKTSIDSMFTNTITSLKLSTMTKEEQYAFYQAQAETARQRSLTSTDPLEIQRQAQIVNNAVNSAQALLTPEQRAQTNPQQIANLEKYNAQVQANLDKQAKAATDANDAFLAKLEAKFKTINDTQVDISKKNNDAADKNVLAANTRKRFEVGFTANVPGFSQIMEVGG